MTTDAQPFSWRAILLPVFLPTLLFSLGEGAIIPVIPIAATERGAGLALAGLVAAMLMIGELAGDLPAGWVVAKVGERMAMVGAAVVGACGLAAILAVPGVVALGVGVLLIGLSTAVFGLARHAFLTTHVPARVRARALSTLAGVFRAGWAIGPFVAAGLIALTRSTESAFWVLGVACAAVVVVLLVLPDPERVFGVARTESSHGVWRAVIEHRGVLVRVGSGVGILAAIRASRTIILPLWAVSIGMRPDAATLVIGVAAAVDFALFYTSGQVMDRFGRVWGALPGLIGLAIGHLVLATTHDTPGRVVWFVAVALLFGLANGMSSGVLMTIGADLAPKDDPAPFLGAYRTIGDSGQAVAPLIVSAVTSLASLALASAAMGVLGLVGAALLWRYLPRYVPRRRGR